ncbi:MAG: flippase [bacterium]|nr:flippase [bacterium]
MSVAAKIAKNTTYLTLSSIVQKILAFGFYIYVAAQFSDVILGRYTFALSFAGIFVIIMNFGLVPVLTREGAKKKESIKDQLEYILGFKIVLSILSLVVMFSVFYLLNLSKDMPNYTVQLVYLSALVIIFDTFRSIFLATLRALQKMQYEALGQIIYQTVVVTVGTVVLYLGMQAKALVLVIALASFVYFIYAVYVVITKAKIKPKIKWDRSQFMPLLKVAAPFALADIFFKLNGSIDTVMLEYLAGDRFVAWYNIALKLTVTLTIIPGAFATAFFPAMSKAFIDSHNKLREIFEQTTQYLILLSVPMSIGIGMLAPKIIGLAFPGHPAAIPALQIFMIGIVFLFVNYPIGNLLNAANKQTINTLNMGIALLLNIILNIFLIPQYTYLGAAASAVISSIVLVALGIPRVHAVIKFKKKPIIYRLIKSIIAASVMALVLYLLREISVLALIPIGVVIYAIVIYLLKGITNAEIKQLKKVFVPGA